MKGATDRAVGSHGGQALRLQLSLKHFKGAEMRMRLPFASTIPLLTLAIAGHAEAGQKKSVPVTIKHEQAPYREVFSGSIGDARASADNLQSIGCSLSGAANVLYGQCYATDATGNSRVCNFEGSTNPAMVQALSTLTPYSVLTVSIDTQYSTCLGIGVDNSSSYLPVAP
jgi:hypothetical protein